MGNAVFTNLSVIDNLEGRRGYTEKIRSEDIGTLHLLPDKNRPTSFLLSAGSSTSWTDAWSSSVSLLYVPVGVKALYLKGRTVFDGDGALDTGYGYVRRDGSVSSSDYQFAWLGVGRENLTSGIYVVNAGEFTVECSEYGIVEYKVTNANTDLYLTIFGYYI